MYEAHTVKMQQDALRLTDVVERYQRFRTAAREIVGNDPRREDLVTHSLINLDLSDALRESLTHGLE